MEVNVHFAGIGPILANAYQAHAKVTALARMLLDDHQIEEYQKITKEIYSNDLLSLYRDQPQLFSESALDELINLFD